MTQNNIDVLIVGAGPVGLFCANELVRHGLTCRIIDKKTTISDKSKALGIHIRTLDVLEDCGLIDDFLKQGQQIKGALFKSQSKTLLHADFSQIDADRNFLIDLPQNQTEDILYKNLQNKGIRVEWETELTHLSQSPYEITATIKKPQNKIELLNANWLIACDGAHSTVRHQVDAEFKGSSYKQSWWLADLLIDWKIPENQMAFYISNQGPLACFPMGNKRYRLVMTAPSENTADPTLEDVDREFKKRSTDKANLANPIWLSGFSIHHRQIQQYRQDRVFFAGDAAHIHSPMGGQGLNTGIQDVYNLVWKLALVEKRKAKAELLNSYHIERFPVGQSVLKKTDVMTRMILLKNPLLVTLRNAFIQTVTSFSRVKNKLLRDLAELDISYATSPIVHRSGTVKKIRTGEFLPDFELIDSKTQNNANRNIITQGTLHDLFIFAGNKPKRTPELINIANALNQQFPHSIQVHLVLEQPAPNVNTSIKIWLDKELQVQRKFGIKKPTLILVRPDKYVGVLQNPINKDKLMKQLYLLT